MTSLQSLRYHIKRDKKHLLSIFLHELLNSFETKRFY